MRPVPCLLAIPVLVCAALSCSRPAPTGSKLAVSASFFTVYDFAQRVGGDLADVVNITPPGTEPHDYEPKARDIARMESARLVVLNGGGFESWGEKIAKNLDPARTLIVAAGENLMTQESIEDHEPVLDPHVWLSPVLAQQMVDKIEHGFAQVDPGNATAYASRAGALKSALKELDAAFRTGLARCATRDITTSHAAFGYLAAAYQLHQVPISGLSPDAEPSPRQLAELASVAKAHHVTTIFFESLGSPKLSQTLATEVGAQTLVLDPLEGLTQDDLAAGKNYLTVMQQNLVNLKTALQCTP